MNSLVKQRIVGAIVLVALGVIFIPMFLTGEGDILSDTDSNVPAKPAYELEAPKVKSLQPKPGSEQAVATATPVDSDAQGEKKPVPPLPGHPADQPLPGVKSAGESEQIAAIDKDMAGNANSGAGEEAGKDIEVVKPGASSNTQLAKTDTKITDSKPATTTSETAKQPPTESTKTATSGEKSSTQVKTAPAEVKPVPVKEVEPTKPAPIVNGYVVQLGSFSVEKNATQLRDKLRKAGHASFVEKHTRNSKTSYRVRVGPELTREMAEKLKAKLKEQTKINGFIVKYPQ